MERRYKFVYLTTNLINGKKYIGKHTTDSLTDGYIGSGSILKRAIEKYGKENFKREILCFAQSIEELNELERKCIKEHNAIENEDFYNVLPGGDGGCANPLCGEDNPMYGRKGELSPVFGSHHSQQTKDTLRQIALKRFERKENHPSYGKHHSDEAKEKMRAAKTGRYEGENNPNYGKKHDAETRKRISEMRKGLTAGAKNPKAKMVVCVETEVVYECASYAAKEYGCDRHWISQCCKGLRETAAGLHWRYFDVFEHANTVPNPE